MNTPVADLSRMMIRMFNELKENLENMQKQLYEYQENTDKKFEKTQKELHELRQDFNKLQN
jgi:uncharacterized membrane-anchored protein YhcB (DUF1043 family)